MPSKKITYPLQIQLLAGSPEIFRFLLSLIAHRRDAFQRTTASHRSLNCAQTPHLHRWSWLIFSVICFFGYVSNAAMRCAFTLYSLLYNTLAFHAMECNYSIKNFHRFNCLHKTSSGIFLSISQEALLRTHNLRSRFLWCGKYAYQKKLDRLPRKWQTCSVSKM